MADLHIFENDNCGVWFIAEDANECVLLKAEHDGYDNVADYQKDMEDGPINWKQVPDSQKFSINIEDEGQVTKLAREWVEEQKGKGFLCGNES